MDWSESFEIHVALETSRVGWRDIAAEVRDELGRQRDEWGEQRHDPAVWYLIVGEEMGEVAKALVETRPGAEARREIVQAIACLAQLYAALEGA